MDDGVGSFDRVDLVAVDDQGSEERSRAMMIIGCDFHARYQQIAMMNDATGELRELGNRGTTTGDNRKQGDGNRGETGGQTGRFPARFD